MISRGQIAEKVRKHKTQHPSEYCPVKDCLWRTKNGDYCPKHDTDVTPTGQFIENEKPVGQPR